MEDAPEEQRHYLFTVRATLDEVFTDAFIDATKYVGFSADDYTTALRVRLRMDSDDNDARQEMIELQQLELAFELRLRFNPDITGPYKVVSEGELPREDLDTFLNSMDRKELVAWLKKAKI